jgi:hypothetical protein
MAISRLRCKRSQIKIQEMSFMLIGLAVFFILVLLFYLAVSLGGMRRTASEGLRAGSILLVSQLAGTPEFACADIGSGGIGCVDADKVLALTNHSEYGRFWGGEVKALSVERVYPPLETNRTVECNPMNYPKCNLFTIIKPKAEESIIYDASYVSLCRQEFKNNYPYTQCDIGKIIIGTLKTA